MHESTDKCSGLAWSTALLGASLAPPTPASLGRPLPPLDPLSSVPSREPPVQLPSSTAVLAAVLALLLVARRGRLLRGRQVKRESVEGRRHAAGSVQLHSARRRQGAQSCPTPYPPIHTPQISGRPCPRRLTR